MRLTAIIHRRIDAMRFAARVARMLWGLSQVFQSVSVSIEVAALEERIEFPAPKEQKAA
jgi:hypothetical protein